jgi:hypothetical protein
MESEAVHEQALALYSIGWRHVNVEVRGNESEHVVVGSYTLTYQHEQIHACI